MGKVGVKSDTVQKVRVDFYTAQFTILRTIFPLFRAKKMYVEIHKMSILVKKLFIDNLKKVPQPILVQLYNMFEMLESVLIEKN